MIPEAIEALRRVSTLDRDVIRWRFAAEFTARRMAEDYLETYQSLILSKTRRLSLVG